MYTHITNFNYLTNKNTSLWTKPSHFILVLAIHCILILLLTHAEVVSRLQHIRITAGAEDLLRLAVPLRVVDAVDVVLHLEHHAPVLGDGAGEVGVVGQPLRLLEGEGAVLPVAAVHLEGVLVRVDVELDARPRRRDGRDGAVRAPVIVAERLSVHRPAVV